MTKLIKLSSIKADLKREYDGVWVDFPDWPGVAFMVSSLRLPAYEAERAVERSRIDAEYPAGNAPPDVLTASAGRLVAKHILHGWRGFDVEYDAATARENAVQRGIPRPDIRRAFLRCAGLAGAGRVYRGRGKKLRKAFRRRSRLGGLTEEQRQIEAWKAELAADPSETADWIVADVLQVDPDPPTPRSWHGFYFHAFDALLFDRFCGAMGGEGRSGTRPSAAMPMIAG